MHREGVLDTNPPEEDDDSAEPPHFLSDDNGALPTIDSIDLWTEPSVCNRPVTGSHGFGSSHRLEQCCRWLAALHRIENVEVPLSHRLLLVDLCKVHPRDALKAFFPPCFRLILTVLVP